MLRGTAQTYPQALHQHLQLILQLLVLLGLPKCTGESKVKGAEQVNFSVTEAGAAPQAAGVPGQSDTLTAQGTILSQCCQGGAVLTLLGIPSQRNHPFLGCEMHLPHYSVLYENNPIESNTSGHGPAEGHPSDSSPFTHRLCSPAHGEP